MKYNKIVAVRLTEKQHDQLKRMARAELTSMGTLIRQGIALKIKQERERYYYEHE